MMVRASRLALWFLLAAALAFAGCASDSKPGVSGPRTTPSDSGGTEKGCADAAPEGTAGSFFPCDVDAILAAKCRRCHTTRDVQDVCVADKTCERAPFPLLVWSDTRRAYGTRRPMDLIARVVSDGYMPFQSTRITPPVEKLTEAEKTTLIQWAEACAPPGNVACGDAAP
jgi:hypothetical protein